MRMLLFVSKTCGTIIIIMPRDCHSTRSCWNWLHDYTIPEMSNSQHSCGIFDAAYKCLKLLI